MFEIIEPLQEIPLDAALPYDCRRLKIRDPKETKGAGFDATITGTSTCCDGDEPCC